MPIQFSNPIALLLLLPLVVFTAWQNRQTVTDLSRERKRVALLLRLVLLAALVFALAGMKWVKKGESLAVVFVADSSRSIRDEQRATIEKYIRDAAQGMHGVDKVGLITFGQEPHTQSSPGQPLDANRLRDPGVTAATNIAQALRQARNELESTAREAGKRIVLLSDGNENAGRALAEVPALAAAHIVLDTVTLPASLKKEALIERLTLPARVKIGEPFPVRVVVSSLTAQTATIALSTEGKPAATTKEVSLHPGKNVVVFEQQQDKVGFYRYRATLDAPDDTLPENNRGESFVWVRGKPTVLYVADNPALTGFLNRALKAQNIVVEYAPPEAMPTSAAALQRFDSVFLSNVPASALTLAQMSALQIACRDFGIGFGMVGGDSSFGAGGYRGTPIEDALPVSMDVKKQKRLPSVAVALVIEDLEIPTTVNMSIEAAKATMDLLEPIDQVGVLDCQLGMFGGGSNNAPAGTWRIPMQHVTDRDSLKAQMQKLTDMGDPPSYDPFLLEAARVLNQTDAKVKHIIFLGDGDAVYEANQAAILGNIGKIRGMGITLSTIATGADKSGINFLAALAKAGNGQAYVADHPQDLPRLLLKDQETFSQPPIIEEPFKVSPVPGDEILKGLDWSGAPPLLGYNVTNLKPTASLALLNANPNRNDPIFAGWRYGLGRSIAFLSDDRAHWAAQWVGWPGYATFWAQAVRWTLRPFAPSDYSTQVTQEGSQGHVTVDALDAEGRYVNGLKLTARIAPPSLVGTHAPPATEEPLRQTAPGHYESDFDAPDIGTYLVNVTQAGTQSGGTEKSTVVGLSTAYSPEYRETQANRYLMSQLAQAGGGRADPPTPAVFGGERPGVFAAHDLTSLLLTLAMLLFPFDIAVRRLAIDRTDLQRFLARLTGRRNVAQTTRAATPELSRLLERKEGTILPRNAEEPTPIPFTVAAQPMPVSRPLTLTRSETPVASSHPLEPPVADASAPVATLEKEAVPEDGMSRLMAAKRRAQQRQEKDSEP